MIVRHGSAVEFARRDLDGMTGLRECSKIGGWFLDTLAYGDCFGSPAFYTTRYSVI